MSGKLYLYPVWVRIWHWSNATLFILLIITGLSLQYSGTEIKFIRFDLAVTIHNFAGVMVSILYAVFILGNTLTDNGKNYIVKRKGLRNKMLTQFKYYAYGIFKNEKAPFAAKKHRKFNPLQLVTYVFVMYLFFPFLIISGFGLLYPETIPHKVFNISGIQFVAIFHSLLGFFLSVFMLIHLYICTLGEKPLSHFKSMTSGFH
jgi:thiosulfate reductase cytochrome b subunit